MCTWPLDSPLHCRLCASHPDIALERERRPSAGARPQRRSSSLHSQSGDISSEMNFKQTSAANAATEGQLSSVASPVTTHDTSADSAENSRFQYKARKTKSYAFLLIFLCAIFVRTSYAIPVRSSGQRLILHTSQYRQRYHQQLLQQQRAQVQPTPHHHHLHHRSVSDGMSDDETNAKHGAGTAYSGHDCQLVVRALKKAQKQANTTFEVIREYLTEFTRNQYHNEPAEMRGMWQLHDLGLKHPYAKHLVRDIDVMPDESHFQHLIVQPISRQMLNNELQKVYITLKTLDNAFIEVIEDRKKNQDKILHDLDNKRESFNIINKFFEEAHRHVRYDLQEIEDAMDKLDIPLPEVGDVEYDRNNKQLRDYLIATEHLSFMQYLRGLYTFLLSQCPATTAQ